MLNWLIEFFEGALFKRICTAVVLVVIGILAIRAVMNIVNRALEKSRLEKAAHSLIT
ncbi:MAG: hypothetical protein ACI4PH_01285, partial [Faecousia sp.]